MVMRILAGGCKCILVKLGMVRGCMRLRILAGACKTNVIYYYYYYESNII